MSENEACWRTTDSRHRLYHSQIKFLCGYYLGGLGMGAHALLSWIHPFVTHNFMLQRYRIHIALLVPVRVYARTCTSQIFGLCSRVRACVRMCWGALCPTDKSCFFQQNVSLWPSFVKHVAHRRLMIIRLPTLSLHSINNHGVVSVKIKRTKQLHVYLFINELKCQTIGKRSYNHECIYSCINTIWQCAHSTLYFRCNYNPLY